MEKQVSINHQLFENDGFLINVSLLFQKEEYSQLNRIRFLKIKELMTHIVICSNFVFKKKYVLLILGIDKLVFKILTRSNCRKCFPLESKLLH